MIDFTRGPQHTICQGTLQEQLKVLLTCEIMGVNLHLFIVSLHSSILAWRIPWTEDPGSLLSMGLQRVGHD